jgi:hypothetical protein
MPKSPAAGWIVYSIEKWEKSDCIWICIYYWTYRLIWDFVAS